MSAGSQRGHIERPQPSWSAPGRPKRLPLRRDRAAVRMRTDVVHAADVIYLRQRFRGGKGVLAHADLRIVRVEVTAIVSGVSAQLPGVGF
jgi:hypothetical protein